MIKDNKVSEFDIFTCISPSLRPSAHPPRAEFLMRVNVVSPSPFHITTFYAACRKALQSFLLLSLVLAVTPAGLAAQRAWQAMSNPSVADIAASFRQPASACSISVTWGWNGDMSREVIARDLDSILRLGFKVATIEAGYKMPAPYLSAGWFELMKIAVAEARKRDMHLWIIDEGKYPSGFAGGLFSKERPDLRMQAVTVAARIPLEAGQSISRIINDPIFSAVAIPVAGDTAIAIDVSNGQLNYTATTGNCELLLVQHQFKTSVTRSANNPTGGKDTTSSLCDYLDPVAVKQFLDFTHEQYYKYVGEAFGNTILGFRGDEPDYAFMPWTPALFTEFRRRKGYDLQPWMASFFAKRLTPAQQRVKADYWDVWSELFGANFFGQQAAWCAAHHLEYMVHLNHDDAMIGLVKSEGDFFKNFRSVQIPGIDVIWHQLWPGIDANFPKFASSAAHLFGRPRAFSECFAAFDPAPDITQARWIINQQLVRGINLFELMFFSSPVSGRGGARGYMADPAFPALAAFTNRACYLLSQGKPAADIAIYFPTTSLWLGHNESEKSTMDLARELSESQIDYDFIDEFSLVNATLEKGSFINKSGQRYNTIIFPSVNTLSQAAATRLQQFVKEGGKLLFTGDTPALFTRTNFLQADTDFKFTSLVPVLPGSLAASLAMHAKDLVTSVKIPSLKYLHRKLADGDMYFLFNESAEEIKGTLTLQGSGTLTKWDPAEGAVSKLVTSRQAGGTIETLMHLKGYESAFFIIGNKISENR